MQTTHQPAPTASTPDPWSADTYPTAMVPLPDRVRATAIKVANELVAAGRPEREAVRLAISRAWVDDDRDGPHDPESMPGPARYLYPERGDWVVETVGSEIQARFPGFERALERASALCAEDNGAVFVFVDGARTESVMCYSGTSTSRPSAFHVVPTDEGWAISRLNLGQSIFARFAVKADAVEAAREMAREAHSRLVIHRADGTAQASHDYRPS